MSAILSSLTSFLPPHSFVMGKKERLDSRVPSETSEAGLCQFCGMGTHQASRLGLNQAEVVFLVEHPSHASLFHQSQEGELLLKIMEAMKLDSSVVEVLVRSSSSIVPSESGCFSIQIAEIKSLTPKVVIALGASLTRVFLGEKEDFEGIRGRIQTRFDLKLIATESLQGMLADARLKKQAWDDLKVALKELN